MAVKFIHTADWQIGKPFNGVADASKRTLLQQERIKAIHRIALLAQEIEAQFVIVAGDLFDSPSPTKSTVSSACSAIGKINKPVYVIPGNHDHGGTGSIWEQKFFLEEQQTLAPNMIILLEPKAIETDCAILFPCPLLRRHDNMDQTAWLRDFNFDGLSDASKARIVIAHGSVQGFGSMTDDEESSNEINNLLEVQKLNQNAFDYIALGDWHGTKMINNKCWYSGTPELDRFSKGGEHNQGNVLVVTVERSQLAKVDIKKTCTINWHEITHAFYDDNSLANLEISITEILENRVDEDLIKLNLSGVLGLESFTHLNDLFERLNARLIRLKLDNKVDIAPTVHELETIKDRTEDPLISFVAIKLLEKISLGGNDGEIARIALRELYIACKNQ